MIESWSLFGVEAVVEGIFKPGLRKLCSDTRPRDIPSKFVARIVLLKYNTVLR